MGLRRGRGRRPRQVGGAGDPTPNQRVSVAATDIIDHTCIGVSDVERSATFHDAALGALGYRRAMQVPRRTAPMAWGMERTIPSGHYAAFVLDPDGNNMEAVYRGG